MAQWAIRIIKTDNGSHPFKVFVNEVNKQQEGWQDYGCDNRTMREARIYANGLADGLRRAGHSPTIWVHAHEVEVPE